MSGQRGRVGTCVDFYFSCARTSPPGWAGLWTFTYNSPALYAFSWSGVSLAPAGALNLSPSFVKGTITGPFLPAAAWWMCAAVGVKPVAVTEPLTAPSSPIVIAPEAEPALLTGGTSWSPDSLTSAATAATDAIPNDSASANVITFMRFFDFASAS